jgi:hypothetical protein
MTDHSRSRSQLVNREDVIFLITHQRSALLEAAERDGMKPHHAEVLRDMASWWGDLAEAVKKLSDRSVTRSESAAPVTPSHVAALTPDWCMDAFWRANPGRNAVVPSLYLLDFAREVLRVHGVTPSSSGAHSPTHITALSPELQEHLEKRAAARRQRDGQPEITEAMVEAAAQRMVALVMARIIEKPQLVQWQQWSGSARAILEAALEAAPVTRSATTRREVELEDALRTLLEWAVLSDPKWYGDRKEVRRARSVLRPTESRTKETP